MALYECKIPYCVHDAQKKSKFTKANFLLL